MAMKDNLMGVVGNPLGFFGDEARARWRSYAAPTLERRVARLQALAASSVQFLLSRLAGKKIAGLRGTPVGKWADAFKQWNPKRDFALAMLHAERLTRVLADAAIAETLLAQTLRFPERGAVLERFLERAEPRCQMNHQQITSTGKRLLALIAEKEAADLPAAG
jgi:hypothetical protein